MARETKASTLAPKLFRDYAGAILIAVGVAMVIRFFIVEAYRIPSQSMKPTLEAGDTVFVQKFPFGLRFPGSSEPFIKGRKPRYGEIVVFSPIDDTQRDYIKRVVALPGDRVSVQSGRLILNRKPVTIEPSDGNRNAICGREQTPGGSYPVCWEPPLLKDVAEVEVPSDSVFVLGDLRSEIQAIPGEHSRKHVIGIIPIRSIKAKATWLWLSIEPVSGATTGWFSRIRFERMFQKIN